MRYLGIDYGKQRIGVAVSDDEGRIALPHSVISSPKRLLLLIQRLAPQKIIVGLPRTFTGRSSAMAKEIKKFAEVLERAVKLRVEFENEIFTSKLARRVSPRAKIDASAAALILQSYLDRINRGI